MAATYSTNTQHIQYEDVTRSGIVWDNSCSCTFSLPSTRRGPLGHHDACRRRPSASQHGVPKIYLPSTRAEPPTPSKRAREAEGAGRRLARPPSLSGKGSSIAALSSSRCGCTSCHGYGYLACWFPSRPAWAIGGWVASDFAAVRYRSRRLDFPS